jgi:hypothetical protein
MIQEELTRPIKNYGEAIRDHLNLRVNLIGLQMSKHLTDLATNLISAVLLAGLLALIMIMLSFAFVFWYGSAVGPYHHGFLIVSLFYTLAGLTLFHFREKLIINPFLRRMGTANFGTDHNDMIARLGKIQSICDLRKREEILKLQLEHSSLVMQQRMQMLNEAYAPKQLMKTVLESVLTSTPVLTRIALVVLGFVRSQNKNKGDEGVKPS